MKKIIKVIIALLFIALIGGVGFVTAISIRGNFDDYILPKGFDKSISQSDSERSDGTYARIMTANLLVNYESWGGTDARKRAKMFFKVLDTYKPDVVALQEMSDQWYCCITKNRGSYKLIYPVSTGIQVNMTAIMYNSDAVKLLDYGSKIYSQGDNKRLRRIVWGLFEDKKTNKQYIVTSTHLDLIREGQENEQLKVMKLQAEEQIALSKELKEQYNCPVFSAGDFNAMDDGGYNDPYYAPEIYNTLANELTDTKYIAISKTQGNNRDADKPTIDHIFLNGNSIIDRYSILSDEVMMQMSDHYPIFIDCKN